MGFVVTGIEDVKNLTAASVSRITQLLAINSVIVIRNQKLTRKQQVDFSTKLGKVIVLPNSFEGNDPEDGLPEIQRVTNYWANGTYKGETQCFGCYWHKDADFQDNQHVASILYADKVSTNSPQTWFLNDCSVIHLLPNDIVDAMNKTVFSVSARDIPDFNKGSEDDFSKFPLAALHPGVFTHPANSRTCVYMTNPFIPSQYKSTSELQKLEEAEKLIIERSSKYYHTWQDGDIVIWDNLAVQHRAGPREIVSQEARMLYRTQCFL